MKFKELKTQIKEQQKQLAARLRRIRSIRKPDAFHAASKEMKEEYEKYGSWRIGYTQKEYRHIHIAYCQFFNKTPYEKIETPRENNKASRSLIESYFKEWQLKLDEEAVSSDS